MLINLCVTENLLFTAERNANKQLLFFKKKGKRKLFPFTTKINKLARANSETTKH